MSNDVESRFDELLEKVEKRARAARIISILLTVIPVVMGLAFLFITINQIKNARNELRQTQASVDEKKAQLEILSQELETKQQENELYKDYVEKSDPPRIEQNANVVTNTNTSINVNRPINVNTSTNTNTRILMLPPRIYVQIQSEAQRKNAAAISNMLIKNGYLVPGIERLDKGPAETQVKFFHGREKGDAEAIVQLLIQAGIKDARTVYIRGYEHSTAMRPRHFEVWFGPSAFQ